MINNNTVHNQPAFTSRINMSQKTAKALNLQPQHIKKAIAEELRMLSNNGRNDVVNISLKEQESRSIRPIFCQVCNERVLNLEVIEKRGVDYYSSKVRKVVNSFNEAYYKPLKIMDLYKSAREKMKPCDTVTNKFMQYV